MKRILSIVITAILAGAFAFTGLAPASASPRTGALHITKECSEYTFLADGFCTITSSNLKMIKPGSRVYYVDAAGANGLDTAIRLDTGHGNVAFGHVTLDLNPVNNTFGTGTVTFNGGTGKFEDFHAWADVYALGNPNSDPNWAWDGTYSFYSL